MKENDELRMFKSLMPLKLIALPKKKELRQITLQRIAECFTASREYTEQEVNEILMGFMRIMFIFAGNWWNINI
ncbi:hypothetical protein K110096F8_01350 [Dielma fastidiosa]|uniref:DUF2087 domain-containing protein n=1 Tax=Dielma fastidiosa TaxID=1034346 RepID=A0AB35UMY6_9FIRM|nr:DUF2087 domain-containing protein [Dielma fastidiosa]MDY5169395.1 DUF2087 domain-containing protein [Dielma fastidiosa]